jgi:hypothetical protein
MPKTLDLISLILLVAIVSLIVLYGGDYLFLRYRLGRGIPVQGVMHVSRYYAVPQKNNRVAFFYDPPDTGECSRSLFPQLGDNPCWYANRKKDNRIDE